MGKTAIFLHNDVQCNRTSSVTDGCIIYGGGGGGRKGIDPKSLFICSSFFLMQAASSHIYKTSLTTDFKQVCSPSSPMHGILRNATGGTSNITGGGSSGPTTAAVNGGAYTMIRNRDNTQIIHS